MNGVHDFGGMHGYGAIAPEADEPPFHGEWEKRALALTLAMGATGQWNIDMSRSARESLPPRQYLSSTYYEIWIAALEKLMIQRGLVSAEELATGHAIDPPRPLARTLQAADVSAVLSRGSPTERNPTAPARFAVGDTVRMRNVHPQSHTRLPRYVRGRSGRVEAVLGCHVFADAHAVQPIAQGAFDESPQWLYTVSFAGANLWGEGADPTLRVSVDAWESYIDSVAHD
jgi:nitrile hydratase beta subunit